MREGSLIYDGIAPPEKVSAEDRFLRVELNSTFSMKEAVDQIDAAIRDSRDSGNRRILADIRAAGFGPPTVFDRYNVFKRWAASAGGAVKMAVVARPEFIDPERIGVTIAENRGFIANVFADESEAIDWLLE